MKNYLFVMLMLAFADGAAAQEGGSTVRSRLVIHGGAGTILKSQMTPELEKQTKDKLLEALDTGYQILRRNGPSLDAVERVLMMLEDDPLFNAGKGAVFTHEGTNELDASIMDGKTLKAGRSEERRV